MKTIRNILLGVIFAIGIGTLIGLYSLSTNDVDTLVVRNTNATNEVKAEPADTTPAIAETQTNSVEESLRSEDGNITVTGQFTVSVGNSIATNPPAWVANPQVGAVSTIRTNQ